MDPLSQAHAEVNALGGADRPGNEYDRGYGVALDDALAVIDRLRAQQSLAADVARAEVQIARVA